MTTLDTQAKVLELIDALINKVNAIDRKVTKIAKTPSVIKISDVNGDGNIYIGGRRLKDINAADGTIEISDINGDGDITIGGKKKKDADDW